MTYVTIENSDDIIKLQNIMICYEPNWSIGSYAADTDYIEDIIITIKSIIKDYYDVNLPILYGGGINEENVKSINEINSVEGLLIGNASLNSDRIIKLYELTK